MSSYRRWLIRGVFLFLLLLCVVGWGFSGSHLAWIGYRRHNNWGMCGTTWGVVWVGVRDLGGPAEIPEGWYVGLDWPREILVPYETSRFLGFGWQFAPGGVLVGLPYWLLLLVLGGLLGGVWRWTRPRLSSAAFPVEISRGGV